MAVGIASAGPRTVLRWGGAAIRLGWSASRLQFSLVTALSVVAGFVPVVAAWATRVLLDELTRGREASSWTVGVSIGVLVVAGIALTTIAAVEVYLQGSLQRNIRTTAQIRLLEKINSFVGIGQFEDPDALDRIRLAESAGDTASQDSIGAATTLVQSTITAAGFIVTLFVLWPPLVAVVVAATVPTAIMRVRLGRMRAATATETTVYQRRQIFYRLLATDVRAAKEIRLFGLGDFLGARLRHDLTAANRAQTAVDRSAARIEFTIGLLVGVMTLIGAVAAAYLTIHGRFTVGDVTVLLAAMVALHAAFGGATDQISRAYESLLLFSHYLVITEAPVPVVTGAPAAALIGEITFDDVWFRYADDLPWVLRGATFRLPAGASVGLVGLNGAGKTTVVKLLGRMYEPQRGHIRWDGRDIAEVDPVSLRARIGAVFQDFMSYDFSAADNIGIGRLDRLGDLPSIRAAARLAEVDEAISALPLGYGTGLSRIFRTDEEGGRTASLSGGQWQRIAIARAFLRDDADVLILDEPSSGLDARTEAALHQRLRELRAGRLSVLISHRLGAMRDADLIIVLESGRVIEEGDHDKLIAANGRYAELFTLQSEAYHP